MDDIPRGKERTSTKQTHLYTDLKMVAIRFNARDVTSYSRLLVVAVALMHVVQATESFDNCSSHIIGGSHPSQYPLEDVSISLCKGGMFAIAYDKPMLNPQYSTWSVTGRQVKNNIPGRAGNFRQDDDLKRLKIPHGNASSSVWSIFWNRGHLAPSRMLSSSDWGKYQTYFYSNVAPQWFAFNQQSWEQCEEALFDVVGLKANSAETIDEPYYVVTGVDYFDREARDGIVRNSSIAMPDFYYTAVCNPLRQQSFAFVGLNNRSNGGEFLFSYRSVRELELMFSSTSGVIFDDKNEDGTEFVCNTRTIDAMFWKMSRFNSISAFPKSYAAGGEPYLAPYALSMADILPLTTLTKFQNATTTNYSSAIAVDKLRLEFEGSEWWRIVGTSFEKKKGTASAYRKGNRPFTTADVRALRAYVRDAFLGSFRKAMRLGGEEIIDSSAQSPDATTKSRGYLKWPAHGYMMEVDRMYGIKGAISVHTDRRTVRLGGGGNSKGGQRFAEQKKKRNAGSVKPNNALLISLLNRQGSTLFSRVDGGENSGVSVHESVSDELPSLKSKKMAISSQAGLVMEISVHRFRSLGLASDNTESENVTAGIASALRNSSFTSLLRLYMREASAADEREGADGRVVFDPSTMGTKAGLFPLQVTILGSDVERKIDSNDDNDDNRGPSEPTTTNARSHAPSRKIVYQFFSLLWVLLSLVSASYYPRLPL